MKIEEYPIYSFSLSWVEDGAHDEKWPNSSKDLPEGRIRNATGFSKMFKEEQTEEQLNAYIIDWWKNYIEFKTESMKNPDTFEFKVEFKEKASWNLVWFSHETFDVGATDKEYLESFEDFVNEKQVKIEMAERNGDKFPGTLMGAEDQWRWKSGSETYHKIPCRCELCTNNGIVSIAH